MKSLSMRLLGCLLVLAVLFRSPALAQECGTNGDDDNGSCCCYSGYSGSDCSTDVGNTCLAAAPTPTPFSTISQPTLDSVSYIADQLVIDVSSPVVNGRKCTTTLNLGVDSTDAVCQTFTKGIDTDTCSDTWTAAIDWSDCIQKCGFVVSSANNDPSVLTYVGYLQVTNNDTVDDDGDTRTEASTFPISVNFPAFLTATVSDIQVVANFSLSAILSDQVFDPSSNKATLVFRTVVPWPYTLGSAAITVPSTFSDAADTFVESSSSWGGSCPATDGSNCVQYWTLQETPNSGTCVLSGEYVISLTPSCRPGEAAQNDCPYIAGDTQTPATITADILSENFCPSIGTNVAVTADLNTTETAGGSVFQNTFMQNHPAYFVFSVSGQAQVYEITLENVTVTNIGELVLNSATTALGTALNYALISGSPASESPFQFTLDSLYFEKDTTYEVVAAASILYQANQAPSKRSVLSVRTVSQASSQQSTTINTAADTEASSPSAKETNAAASLNYASALAAAALLAACSALLA